MNVHTERSIQTAVTYGHYLYENLHDALEAHLEGDTAREIIHLQEVARYATERIVLVVEWDKGKCKP